MTLTCDVEGCEDPALAAVHPTHGETEHHALRCRDCLIYDLEREWFGEWRQKINARNGSQVGGGDDA